MTTQTAESIAPAVALPVPMSDVVPVGVLETAARLGVLQHLPAVIQITREVYGRFSEVSVSVDPEIPDDTHIVFRVPVNCSIDEALDMDEEWGRRVLEIIPRSPQVYLPSLDFQR